MRKGLYANIHAKRKRGGKMRKKVQRDRRQRNNLGELLEQLRKNNA